MSLHNNIKKFLTYINVPNYYIYEEEEKGYVKIYIGNDVFGFTLTVENHNLMGFGELLGVSFILKNLTNSEDFLNHFFSKGDYKYYDIILKPDVLKTKKFIVTDYNTTEIYNLEDYKEIFKTIANNYGDIKKTYHDIIAKNYPIIL